MGLSGILFNPQGRISPAEFWRGLIVLIGISIVITVVSAYSPLVLALTLGIVSILLIYPIICVYGKRFHDTGQTAWLVLAVLVLYFGITMALSYVLAPILAPEVEAFQTEFDEKVASGVGFAEMMELVQAQARITLVLNIIVTLIASLLTGFFVARLESDPDENEHGMPTSGAATDTFS